MTILSLKAVRSFYNLQHTFGGSRVWGNHYQAKKKPKQLNGCAKRLKHLMGYVGEKKASGSLQNRHVHSPKFQLNPISNFAVIFI